jgi:hypothetical protein
LPASPTAIYGFQLDHDNHDMREKFRQFLKSPLFQPRYDLTLDEERELGNGLSTSGAGLPDFS